MTKTQQILAAAGALAATACSGGSGPLESDFDLTCSIPSDMIVSGGVARDGIPALSDPDWVIADRSILPDNERVLGMVVNGEARAYPFIVMWWHEVVNDNLGGMPILPKSDGVATSPFPK